MTYKDILVASQALQSAALVGDAYALVRKKKKTTSDFLGVGTRNIVGTSLIKAQADITGGM
jgi:ribosomal protein S2